MSIETAEGVALAEVAESTNPVEGDQTEVAETNNSTPEAPVKTYTVKVGGIEHEVAEDELLKGYQRQADYTRKTQALSAREAQLSQAEELVNFLRQDPQRAIATLARQYGLNVGGDELGEDDYEDADPALDEIRSELQELKLEKAREQVRIEADRLKTKYDLDDKDIAEVAQHAIAKGFPTLQDAYASLHFDDAIEALRSKQALLAEEERALQQKREAVVVTSGAGGSPAAQGKTVQRPQSFEEAFALAKQGISYDG